MDQSAELHEQLIAARPARRRSVRRGDGLPRPLLHGHERARGDARHRAADGAAGPSVLPPRLPADAPRDRRRRRATARSPRDAVRRSLGRSSSNGCSRSGRWKRSAARGTDGSAVRRSRLVVASGFSSGSIFDPVARVLVEEGQRLERPHPIEEQHAVEMIGLVLDDARRKIVRAQLDALAVPVERAHLDLARPRHAAADVGDAQAAFPVLDDVGADDGDLGVDDRERRRFRLVVLVAIVERGDEQPEPLVHLRRGQTDAVILDHRVDHVVDQLLHDRAADLGLLERPRLRAQHRDGPSARLSGSTYRRNYTGSASEGAATAQILHPHDDSHAYRFCPRCGGALERRLLKPTEPERLVCTRCGFVFYLDPKIAVGTIIRTRERPARAGPARDRAGLRQVGVPRRLRRPRRAADGGRHPRGARGMRPRRPARRPGQHLLLRRPRAGHRRLRGDRDWRHAVRRRRVPRKRRVRRRDASRGTSSRSAARTRDCATTLPARASDSPWG